jgi:excisionase family DNA binding protein
VPDTFLTIADVERRLQISRSTVLRLIEQGELTAHHITRRIRIDPASVDAYIERSRITKGDPTDDTAD